MVWCAFHARHACHRDKLFFSAVFFHSCFLLQLWSFYRVLNLIYITVPKPSNAGLAEHVLVRVSKNGLGGCSETSVPWFWAGRRSGSRWRCHSEEHQEGKLFLDKCVRHFLPGEEDPLRLREMFRGGVRTSSEKVLRWPSKEEWWCVPTRRIPRSAGSYSTTTERSKATV